MVLEPWGVSQETADLYLLSLICCVTVLFLRVLYALENRGVAGDLWIQNHTGAVMLQLGKT